MPTAAPSTSTTKVTASSEASLPFVAACWTSNCSLVSGAGADARRSSQVSRSEAMLNNTSESSAVRARSETAGISSMSAR